MYTWRRFFFGLLERAWREVRGDARLCLDSEWRAGRGRWGHVVFGSYTLDLAIAEPFFLNQAEGSSRGEVFLLNGAFESGCLGSGRGQRSLIMAPD